MQKVLLYVLIGGVAGYAIGYIGRAAKTTRTFICNPWISMVIGIVFGLLAALGKDR